MIFFLDNFCLARAKAAKAENSSELNTEEDNPAEEQRVSKRNRKKRIISSSESSDEEQSLTLKKKQETKRTLPLAPVWPDSDDNLENTPTGLPVQAIKAKNLPKGKK